MTATPQNNMLMSGGKQQTGSNLRRAAVESSTTTKSIQNSTSKSTYFASFNGPKGKTPSQMDKHAGGSNNSEHQQMLQAAGQKKTSSLLLKPPSKEDTHHRRVQSHGQVSMHKMVKNIAESSIADETDSEIPNTTSNNRRRLQSPKVEKAYTAVNNNQGESIPTATLQDYTSSDNQPQQ